MSQLGFNDWKSYEVSPDQPDRIPHWPMRVRLVELDRGLASSPESDCRANHELDSSSVSLEQLRKRAPSFDGSVKTLEHVLLLQLRLKITFESKERWRDVRV